MKKFEINITEQTASINGLASSLEEIGLSHTDTTDACEILEDISEIHGDDIVVVFI